VENCFKRDVFNELNEGISSIQSVYIQLAQDYARQIGKVTNVEQKKIQEELENAIVSSNFTYTRLEFVKKICGACVLTDGAIVGLDELSKTTKIVDDLLKLFQVESKDKDKYISAWGKTKMQQLSSVKDALLQIMEHKIKRKNNLEGRFLN